MTTPTNPADPFSPFLPTTFNPPEEDDRHDIFLQDTFSNMADVINDKTIGTWILGRESFSGEKYWYKSTKITRNGYRTMVYIPILPNTSSITFTIDNPDPNLEFPISGIDPEFVITSTWGTASRPPTAKGSGNGDYFTFLNDSDPRITWTMSDTVIVLTSTVDLTAYSGFLFFIYVRNGI